MSICKLTLRDSILGALWFVHLTCWPSLCLPELSNVDDDNSMRVPVRIRICFCEIRKLPPPIIFSTLSYDDLESMSLRSAIRSSLARTGLPCLRCRQHQMRVISFPILVTMAPSSCRGYTNEWPKPREKKFDLPDEYKEEVFRALTENPPVMQALHHVIESLDKRGIKLDKEPDISQMWRIMKDKEIIDNLKTRTSPLYSVFDN
jgi:hypothetical protein